jgi:hypothetical protein
VSENRLLRIFGTKREGGSAGRLKKFHDMYTSPNIIMAIKLRMIR